MRDDDEDAERERQRRERSRLTPEDRIHGEVRRTKSGLPDRRSKGKRKYRVVQFPLRLRLRTSAMIDRIVERDQHPSNVELFEVMLEAYLEKYGPIPEHEIPSDEDLVNKFLKQQDDDDGQ